MLWSIIVDLLGMFVVGLDNAIRRDRVEIHNIEMLVKGRKAEAGAAS